MIWAWGKRWLLFAVGVPVLAWLVDTVADRLEARRGHSDVTRGMHGAAGRIRELKGGRGRGRSRGGLLRSA
jgi:membrane protein implicated in regulation of membrane protease activity